MTTTNDWYNLGAALAQVPRERIAAIDCIDPDQPRSYTYGELNAQADACARGMLQRGLARGDRVAVMSTNRVEMLVAVLGIMRAGLVAVPVNHKLAQDTVDYVFADCDARLALVDAQRAAMVPGGTPVLRLDGDDWQALLSPGDFEAVRVDENECALILYTSGSTGKPKGVQLGHGGQLWALRSRRNSAKPGPPERMVVAAPLFHMNALASCQLALCTGNSFVLLPQFDARQFIDAIGKFEVSWITSVPTMMAMVVREQQALAAIDTRGVRYVRMGSAPATPQLYAEVKKAFPNAAIAGGYGTTEGGPIVFGPVPGQTLALDGGLGWPLPQVEVRVLDAAGQEAAEGELWLRTPANMLGYLNLAEKTRAVLTEDNWYRTGDIFRRDAAGCFYFVGRADDMFNCGGENIYPGEVEQVIERMPAVVQACVVPVPDELKGHKPVAFVVRREAAALNAQEVKDFVLANAPPYQHPRKVFFLPALPLAATNKVDRKALQQLALAAP